jgi:N utilization substance protein B
MTESTPKPQSLKEVMEQLNAPEIKTKSLSAKDKQARTVARLVLVQALYQMELTGQGVETIVREFSDFRFDSDLEGEPLGEGDIDFFSDGLRTVVKEQSTIDRVISERLASGWRLDRIDTTLRAILRSGAWELGFRKDIGKEVVINEYVEIAKAFFGETEAKFVNGALDGIARDVR